MNADSRTGFNVHLLKLAYLKYYLKHSPKVK